MVSPWNRCYCSQTSRQRQQTKSEKDTDSSTTVLPPGNLLEVIVDAADDDGGGIEDNRNTNNKHSLREDLKHCERAMRFSRGELESRYEGVSKKRGEFEEGTIRTSFMRRCEGK